MVNIKIPHLGVRKNICKCEEFALAENNSFAALGDGGNVIYVNPKQKIVIIVASYFKPRVEDRMKLIKEYIEPVWSE